MEWQRHGRIGQRPERRAAGIRAAIGAGDGDGGSIHLQLFHSVNGSGGGRFTVFGMVWKTGWKRLCGYFSGHSHFGGGLNFGRTGAIGGGEEKNGRKKK
jgi:hypothetical protein